MRVLRPSGQASIGRSEYFPPVMYLAATSMTIPATSAPIPAAIASTNHS